MDIELNLEEEYLSPYIAIIHVENQTNQEIDIGRRYKLYDNTELLIGHDISAQVQLPKELVAQKQAKICYQNGNYYLRDLSEDQSTLNSFDMIAGFHPLKRDGELFRTGPIVFKFFTGKGAESAYDQTNFSRSRIDGLTKAYNKKYIFERIEDELSWFYRPEPRLLSLMILDIDYFKKINDTYGHLGGDKVLKTVCERIKNRLRKHEKLGRFGGDELVVIMPSANKEKARKLAEEIRLLICEEPILYENHEIHVTLSIGITTVEKEAAENKSLIDAYTLLNQADKKLYEAKKNGRNQMSQ